ncbi:MAG: SUMF1/EgtB/PvdO family nonheme iron enzyme [Anaerolineaceae bacterium]|nr:SUMF1/EgtB/PvdO family nonheme iron enzyme [Anaerolineaceae bacterium]
MMKTSKIIFSVAVILLILLCLMVYGAYDSVKRGSGFLFIPSITPSITNTATSTVTETMTSTLTATETPTETPIPTETPTMTATCTDTPIPTATFTPVPTQTQTVQPTFDETAWVERIYLEVTASVQAYLLAQTPSATPIVSPSELVTGLHMVNQTDQKDMLFIEKHTRDAVGFWIDWNEVTNAEYSACVASGYCSLPGAEKISGRSYYSDYSYQNYPVVNVTRGQASAYCSWAGMHLMSKEDWEQAVRAVYENLIVMEYTNDGPVEINSNDSKLFGNVWEWTTGEDDAGYVIIAGGSWKNAVQDVMEKKFAHVKPNSYAEDIGFRCVSYVSSEN